MKKLFVKNPLTLLLPLFFIGCVSTPPESKFIRDHNYSFKLYASDNLLEIFDIERKQKFSDLTEYDKSKLPSLKSHIGKEIQFEGKVKNIYADKSISIDARPWKEYRPLAKWSFPTYIWSKPSNFDEIVGQIGRGDYVRGSGNITDIEHLHNDELNSDFNIWSISINVDGKLTKILPRDKSP